MTPAHKARLIVNAVYKDGTELKKDYATPAAVNVLAIHGFDKYRELNLRIVVDAKDAEELMEGILNGIVYLSIEQMLSPVDREAKTK